MGGGVRVRSPLGAAQLGEHIAPLLAVRRDRKPLNGSRKLDFHQVIRHPLFPFRLGFLISLSCLCCRYVSPNQAERACSQNGSFLNSGTMIAVSRMNATVASSMGVGLREGGQLLVPLDADFSSGGGDSRRKGDRPLLLTDYSSSSSSSSSSGVTSRLGRGATQVDGVPFQRQAARTPMSSSSSARKERPPSSSSSSAEESEDLSDIYVKPPRRPSICKQLMEYLFSFKY